jgi:precorrin-2 dehydrogenase/sirohydrochlorin ferrochelatase
MRSFDYPVYLDLSGVPVLVVGAGRIAARKVEGLAAAGALVCVVAARVSSSLDRALVAELRERPFEPDDVSGVRLVVTATGDRSVDAAVAAAATAAGIWVNAADQPDDCSFILPAIARNGPLTVAVSTGGASPALARRLRDRAGALLTDEVVALAAELAAERTRIRAAGGSTEDVDWNPLIDRVLGPVRDARSGRDAQSGREAQSGRDAQSGQDPLRPESSG